MFTRSALVLTISLFIYCEAAYVDTFPKCSIKDSECLKAVYEHIIKTVGTTGNEELGISRLDPMDIKRLSVTLLDAITINITEGSMKGMAKCVLNTFTIDWEKERAFLNVSCDVISIKGQFEISGENAQLQSIIGSNNLNGQGRAKIKLENVNLNIYFSLYVTKKDGEMHLALSNKNLKYTYDIGNAHFKTENVIFANNDLSQVISTYLNENWKETIKQFGHIFLDKALELYVGLVASVYDKVPAKHYVIEDISSYLKH